jgi:hypothetical protein
MGMKVLILDQLTEITSTCYLSKISLREYIVSLPENYQSYEVQREIVKNTYLDNLIETVLEKKHIPPIVLVVDSDNYSTQNANIEIETFKILDGLQRTFRLKAIWETLCFFVKEAKQKPEMLSFTRLELSKQYSQSLSAFDSNANILFKITTHYNTNNLENADAILECFDKYQWFEIWTELSAEDEVRKMLILNAGHKPVKTKHQLELLFRNLIPVVKKVDLNDFQLVREKEINSTSYSKNRMYGQFHFSHLITSVLSLDAGKPVTSNTSLVLKAQNSDFDFDSFEKYFNYQFLHMFIDKLLKLDKEVSKVYHEGVKWIGRETSLVGLFAALGKYSSEEKLSPFEALEVLQKKIIDNTKCLDLVEFEKVRNSLDLSKINIGTVNKNAVYNGVYHILIGDESTIRWTSYFKGQTS